MDKSELKEIADSVFERYPDKDKVFVTSDGQAFLEEIHAKNHATPTTKRKELVIEAFLRESTNKGAFALENMDREQLEAFIKENKLEVVFYAETPDEDLRTMIANAIGAEKKTKKSSKKSK